MATVFDTFDALREHWAIHGEPQPGIRDALLSVATDPSLSEAERKARLVGMIRARLFADYEDPEDDPELGEATP